MQTCKNCGSKYVNHVSKNEDFEKIENTYICQACKKEFKTVTRKSSPQGEWLMSFFADVSGGNNRDSVVINKTADGKISIRQQQSGVYKQVYVLPKFYPKYNPHIWTAAKYSIWYDTFRHFNDANGSFITVARIELNPSLTKKALQNAAMKIIHKEKNVFVPGFQENDILLKDVCSWISNELKGMVPEVPQNAAGCYVATAVYGSYDCPEVWTLRRFRDNTLAETWYGRAFIRTYYTISPTLVKWFGNTNWFKKIWKGRLDNLVCKLQKNGVENTPYKDKNWN